jgi:hypothetical protein
MRPLLLALAFLTLAAMAGCTTPVTGVVRLYDGILRAARRSGGRGLLPQGRQPDPLPRSGGRTQHAGQRRAVQVRLSM